jgi:hypothetical protein
MKSSRMPVAVACLLPMLVAGCATGGVVTQWKKPTTMTPIDTRITLVECEKQGLMARKRALGKNRDAGKGGVASDAFIAQQGAIDSCMRSNGMKMTKRVYR